MSNKIDYRATAISVALHCLLALPLLLGASQPEQQQQGFPPGGEPSNVIPKTQAENEKETPKTTEVEIFIVEKKKSKDKGVAECEGDNWYGGIGVRHDYITETVYEVFKGYAAERAGLRVGDRIINVDRIRGEPGTICTLLIERDGQTLVLNITREKICLDPNEP